MSDPQMIEKLSDLPWLNEVVAAAHKRLEKVYAFDTQLVTQWYRENQRRVVQGNPHVASPISEAPSV